jgi:hypothetical protein
LAIGYTRLSDDPALVTSVERAIGYYLSASGGGEVLDIRVPVACIGLEILGWALLQKRGWIGPDALSKGCGSLVGTGHAVAGMIPPA